MSKKSKYTMNAKVWLYPGAQAAWHFISLPKKESREIKEAYASVKRGWGSLPVEVSIGETTWNTSIFPDSKAGTFILPLKAAVRKKEGIYEDDEVAFSIAIRV